MKIHLTFQQKFILILIALTMMLSANIFAQCNSFELPIRKLPAEISHRNKDIIYQAPQKCSYHVKIYSQLGEVVSTQTIEGDNKINTENLTNGQYIVVAISEVGKTYPPHSIIIKH